MVGGGGGGQGVRVVGGGGCGAQLSTFDGESKSAKTPYSLYGGGGGAPRGAGGWDPTSNF